MRFFWLVLLFGLQAHALRKCALRRISGAEINYVCVCNSTYCDDFPRLGKLQNDQAAVYTSSMSGKRFNLENVDFGTKKGSQDVVSVKLNAQEAFQSIIGFGGAFTDSAGFNLQKLTPEAQENLMNSYFSDQAFQALNTTSAGSRWPAPTSPCASTPIWTRLTTSN
ncbi:hypothetical protein L596_005586 [Steinernema carpocapsae]|uniref:Glucosylceramidase n=1 Tax=Steinernema carpocapsae TaxID=34508 RepID=A0A4U8UZH2_STECR|nr:hypothetical protein L596_005586 [Steinernema carpocapsae]